MNCYFLSLGLLFSINAIAAPAAKCAPSAPASCNVAKCNCYYCLGPIIQQGNAPVRPHTCNGDFTIKVAGFYWNSHQDGLEYAIDNGVAITEPTFAPALAALNNLTDSKYKSPEFKWNFGFDVGIGYNSPCDGWDIDLIWTHYKGKGSSKVDSPFESNRSLLPLWTAFLGAMSGHMNFATLIETKWDLDLNLVDLSLGREYWTSRYLSLRPFIGLRGSLINQHFMIQHRGGSWAQFLVGLMELQPPLKDTVNLHNDFRGVGPRSGLDSIWNLGCGLGIYQNFATSIVYGRFDVDHNERLLDLQDATKYRVLDTSDHLRTSRAMIDLELGLQWRSLLCQCRYGLAARIGWEFHLFFHQNQMWLVNRVLGDFGNFPNPTGCNTFQQRRGNLYTQGWTLSFAFDF